MSKIEWTDKTWNPIVGCNKISTGCKNCYAETMANRLAAMAITNSLPMSVGKYTKVIFGKKWNNKTYLNQDELIIPLKRKKPTTFFVCSMGDLFHESVPFEWIDTVFSVMSDCDQHIYQVLTKRPERLFDFYQWKNNQTKKLFGAPWLPKDNIWFGVSAENQEMADNRIPILLKIPTTKRFVSVEPMLSKIDLSKWLYAAFLIWVICGGESGPNARPMHPDWVRNLKDQCETANVPFFFKQWGEWKPDERYRKFNKGKQMNWLDSGESYQWMAKVGKKNAGSTIDGKQYKQIPSSNF